MEGEGPTLKEATWNKTVTFTPRDVLNLLIACKLDRWSQDLDADITLKDCL